nr:immunoglobulin heavy chain junction region [Macaca mulatta]
CARLGSSSWAFDFC